MDRDSLEKRSNLAAQADIVAKIGQLNQDLKQLKDKYMWMKEKNFSAHYGCSARETLDQYAKRLAGCCGQGGTGYRWWLDGYPQPSFCHCVVISYKEAQPTKQELDAFWVINDREMVVTKTPHTERWGN